MELDEAKKSKYLIIRPNPQTGLLEVVSFNTKIEVEGFMNGCANPEDCVPAIRLDIEYRLKCKRLK